MALGSEIMWSSHDNCATMCHLIGRPSSWQTWDPRVPTLFLSNLFSSNGILMLLNCSAVSACVPVLNPNSEADCMCPVPCLHPHLLQPHVDSCHSYRCLLDSVPIAYLCL